jgi:AmiR/NasT family two-component response regulator
VVSQPPRERAVSQAFVALADTMADDYDIIDLLDQLIAHSVALLAADAAGILLGDSHRQLRVAAASSYDAELMELLPEADLLLGQALADVATIGILQERAIRRGEVLNEQLQTGLTSRVVVEQAKGVLAQQNGISMDAAFDQLRRYARAHSLRLANVARQLATRRLDPATITPAPTCVRR